VGAKNHQHLFRRFGPSNAEIEKQQRLRDERDRAEQAMAYQFANLQMPEDIRARARSWGMETWAEVLWNNAFQAGYREARRDNVKER